MTECIHGMPLEWCAYCTASSTTPGQAGGTFSRGRTKQEVLNLICDQLGVARQQIGEGSSLPSGVFDVIRERLDLQPGSMPEVAEATVVRAGLAWEPEFDSRGTPSGGGSTVTLPGLERLNLALSRLL